LEVFLFKLREKDTKAKQNKQAANKINRQQRIIFKK